jgi:hypothetical protein
MRPQRAWTAVCRRLKAGCRVRERQDAGVREIGQGKGERADMGADVDDRAGAVKGAADVAFFLRHHSPGAESVRW